jgi:hypothetical protein
MGGFLDRAVAKVGKEEEEIPRMCLKKFLLTKNEMKRMSVASFLSLLDLPIALDRDRLRLTRYTPLPFTLLPARTRPCHRTVPPSRFILAFSDLMK